MHASNGASQLEAEQLSYENLSNSPFGAAEFGTESHLEQGNAFASTAGLLESPFAEAMALTDETSHEVIAMESVLGELEDEEFDEAVQGLVDEAAARHLTSSASWSSESEAPAIAASETEAWVGSVASEADRLLERLSERFAERTADTFNFAEFEMEGDRLIAEAAPQVIATEQFFKKLIRKAGKVVKGAVNLAKKGLSAVGKLLPFGKIFDALRRLVKPLLKKVLQTALNRLPVAVRPLAQRLAAKLFGSEAEAPQTGMGSVSEATEAFDAQLAESLLAPNDSEINALVAEAEAEAALPQRDPVADLDHGRARLARQLEAATPGVSPIAEVEQFIPIVMAALPFIRTGISIIGRDKVVSFLADKLAGLIKGHIGADAAKQIAGPIVDVGLRALTLEAETTGGAGALGAEAMVATLEDTIRAVSELSAEAWGNPLRLETELYEAFTEAAGRHIPRRLLSRKFVAVETAHDRGVWVYMPRATRPTYRYKKFTHVFRVPISQPVARAIRFPAGDTLERRLLDGGARVWPVESEVHLYEALPGTQMGHLSAFETEAGVGSVAEVAAEFEVLTPEVASMLINEPGLGAQSRIDGRAKRLFRVVAQGVRVGRASRFTVRLDAASATPALRIHLRLSERESHAVAAALGRKAHAQVIGQLRVVLGVAFRTALGARLTRHLSAKTGLPVSPARPAELAEKLAESMLGVISLKLPESATVLGQAARDAASGLTLSFDYRFTDKSALLSGEPKAPTMMIRAGWHRD